MKVARWNETTPPRDPEIRARLEGEGYSVYPWTDPPGTTYPPHKHAEDQSHWVLRGAIELTVNGEVYELRAGDRDWMPAGTVHTARVVGDEPVTYLVGAKPR